jgi:ligand-binding SRPBCC domain-containing protein
LKTIEGGDCLITVETQIEIAAPIDRCFQLATDIDLHTQTVWKHTQERAIAGVMTGQIGHNQTVTFQARHFWIRQTLTSKITEYETPRLFVDEMQKGAFKSLRHIHQFEERNGKTIMKDILIIEAPLGFVGWIVERLILKRYMKRFIEDRNKELKKIAERF